LESVIFSNSAFLLDLCRNKSNITESQTHFNNDVNSSNRNLEHELEKCQLVIEQQAKEIGYLKDIIALLQKQA